MKDTQLFESVERELEYYNLDVITSVRYRVKSQQGAQFRIWATQRLKEYIIKGFALNDERFKTGTSMNYFNELHQIYFYFFLKNMNSNGNFIIIGKNIVHKTSYDRGFTNTKMPN